MRKANILLSVLVFLSLIFIGYGSRASADVYGYELRIIANNGLQNGDKVPVEDVKQGQLSFKLEVIDPAKPNVPVKADEWQVAVYSADGVHLADFVVRGKEATDYAYQATINALGDIAEQYNGKAIILKAKAKVGEQYTNEVSFRVVLGAESVGVAPTKQGFPWLWAFVWFVLFLLLIFLIFFLFKKKKYELKVTPANDLVDGGQIFIQDVLSGRLSFKLEVTDPDESSKIVKVDEWQVAAFTVEGIHLADFVVSGDAIEDNIHQVMINLSPAVSGQYNGKTIVIKFVAIIGTRHTNEVQFKATFSELQNPQ
jgi:hypothetical protein